MTRQHILHPLTAYINKKQQIQSKKQRTEALSWLAQQFPEAFDNTIRIRPLKIGIMQDILNYSDIASKAGISTSKLREAVVLFTRRVDYLTCIKAQEMRIDLHGNAICVVTVEEAQTAAHKIKRHIEAKGRQLQQESGQTFRTDYKPNKRETLSSQNIPSMSERGESTPLTTPQTRPDVIIKHKTARTFDPSAIARLKEKLGLVAAESKGN